MRRCAVLDVAQHRLGLVAERLAELAQPVAHRAGVGQHLVRQALGLVHALRGLAASLLAEPHGLGASGWSMRSASRDASCVQRCALSFARDSSASASSSARRAAVSRGLLGGGAVRTRAFSSASAVTRAGALLGLARTASRPPHAGARRSSAPARSSARLVAGLLAEPHRRGLRVAAHAVGLGARARDGPLRPRRGRGRARPSPPGGPRPPAAGPRSAPPGPGAAAPRPRCGSAERWRRPRPRWRTASRRAAARASSRMSSAASWAADDDRLHLLRGDADARGRLLIGGSLCFQQASSYFSLAGPLGPQRLLTNLQARWSSRYDPSTIEPKWQRVWADEHTWEVSNDARRAAQGVRARDAALPLGRAAHRPPEGLLASATRSPTSGAATASACCSRWATTPSACPPRTTRSRPASTRAISTEESIERVPRQFRSWGISIDWSRELGTHEPDYYRWTQWIFLRLFEQRPRLPQGGGGQVVPQRPDRAGQRAGDRRPLRALRPPGRGAPARAVVLPDHRLRRPPARRPARRSSGRRTWSRCSATGSAARRAPR